MVEFLLRSGDIDSRRRGKKELEAMAAAFDHCQPVSPDLVPVDSLLREFIGGGSYHY